MRRDQLQHRFVDFIPEQLEEGVLYVSIEYMTVTHLCCCGCGQEVSITLSPKDWRLIFDGKTISIEPSIGSWNLPCQSHYFITRDRVEWAAKWSRAEIEAGRQCDSARRRLQSVADSASGKQAPIQESRQKDKPNKAGILNWLRGWW